MLYMIAAGGRDGPIMPKSRMAKRGIAAKGAATKGDGGGPGKGTSPRRALLVAAAVALVGVGAWFWYAAGLAEDAFLDHAARGQEALAKVVRPANQGAGHVARGEGVRYLGDPPTSGPHDPSWATPGFYREHQQRERLVHALEHGLIVIYYDQPDPATMDTLEGWADLYGGPWSGLVVAPKAGLGEAIILTAWVRLLRLAPFDADAAAAFIDEYRGRGPERQVR